jgi:hypothetical protein
MTENLKPCKVCGSAPVLFRTTGAWESDTYVCSKALIGECRRTEIEAEKKARAEWNEDN